MERPDSHYGRSQVRKLLETRLAELPEDFRIVFVLRSAEELAVGERAEILGIPEETVRSRHFRAKSLLRGSLEKDLDLAERDLFEFAGAQCDGIIARLLERSVMGHETP